MSNPEQPVIDVANHGSPPDELRSSDAIDALVDQQLETGPKHPTPYPKCRCGQPWHGLPDSFCKGNFQPDDEPFDTDYQGEELELPQFPSGIGVLGPIQRALRAIAMLSGGISAGILADLELTDEDML